MPRRPPWGGSGGRAWLWLLLAGIVATGLVAAFAGGTILGALEGRGERIRFVYLGLLLIFLLASAGLRWRQRPAVHLRHALLWASVALALVVAYSFRYELAALWSRVAGELDPRGAVQVEPGRITIRADATGHFRVRATVDGAPVTFLVDTGASVTVLAPEDARRIGFDPSRLAFSQRFQTANGTVLGAPVRLGELRIGDIVLRDVRASVNRAPMGDSLLGMSALGRLSGYSVGNGTLTLVR